MFKNLQLIAFVWTLKPIFQEFWNLLKNISISIVRQQVENILHPPQLAISAQAEKAT